VSNTETMPVEQACGQQAEPRQVIQRLSGRAVQLNTRLTPSEQSPRDALEVERFLPTRGRRMVGAWCFLDRYGPADVSASAGMQVAPHPHTGLQTVSWLLAGEILHRDSVGSVQMVRPGELNLMTAGHGISHSERSPQQRPDLLRGVQLWTALPAAAAGIAPHFEHHADLPVLQLEGARATVVLGTLGSVTSPATAYTPIVGADVVVSPAFPVSLPLRPDFEHAVLVLDGEAVVAGERVGPDELVYLGSDRQELGLESAGGARLLLLGGEPFDEQIVMWWNFIGRSHDEVVAQREDWEAEADRFGVVVDDVGPRLPAPPLPGLTLRPRGRA
jgi:quercetin 2,3-dioxygenase